MSIVVIGGGPAGLAAANEIAKVGEQVVLIDGASHLGGQYWRGVSTPLIEAVQRSPRVKVMSNTSVWNVTADENGFTIRVLTAGVESQIRTTKVVIATGAHDRVLPFPGWDLPGVMTAGGAQALLKGQRTAFANRVIVAGSGPFLLPVAAGLIDVGVDVVELAEARSPLRWARHPRAVVGNPSRIVEALRYRSTITSSGTWISFGTRVVEARGNGRVEEVDLLSRGEIRTVVVDGLAVGWGFTPDLSVAMGLGITPSMTVHGEMVIEVDSRHATTLPGVFAAGEITGVGGFRLALIEGAIAGRAAVGQSIGWGLRERRAHYRSFARALSDVYAIDSRWQDLITDDTVICRCEEVTMGTIRSTITDLGASDPRSLKLLARTGMGMCQGRICGQAVAEIVARECGRDVRATDLLAHRPVITPIPLGTLAAFPGEDEQ